jgi:hypothetical protein
MSPLNVLIATEVPIVYPRILILGDPGAGKTHLIGMLHEMTKKFGGTNGVFLGDFDKGYPTLRSAGFDVNFKPYIDEDSNKPTAWKNFCDDTEVIYKEGNKENYSFIAADSFTTIQNALFNDIILAMGTTVIKNRVHYRKIGLTTKHDFGVFERVITNDFFPEFIKICDKFGVIMTVHTEYMQPVNDDGNPIGPARIMPKVKGHAIGAATIGLYFNEVIYCKVAGAGNMAQRKIQTAKDAIIDLKTQTAGMPAELTFEEYVFRIGVNYGYLKGEQIQKYAIEKKIEINKLANFKIPILKNAVV